MRILIGSRVVAQRYGRTGWWTNGQFVRVYPVTLKPPGGEIFVQRMGWAMASVVYGESKTWRCHGS